MVMEAVLDGEEQAAQMEQLRKEQEQNIKVSLTSLTPFDFTAIHWHSGHQAPFFCTENSCGLKIRWMNVVLFTYYCTFILLILVSNFHLV